jgi:ribose/xylose/arabinose/galactoside ABC-type transport system permease subunit
VLLYTIGGLFTGLAGVMLFSRLTVGDPTVSGLELDVIAAVVIGGASLSGGHGTIAGSMIGALVMTVLDSGCVITGVPTYMQDVIKGAIIIAAVAIERRRP